jgi:N-acetylglucosamine malate deacetylase 2
MKLTDIHNLVCVFAHPDDEAFGPGASIAYFASKIPVRLICVTDGGFVTKTGKKSLRLEQVRKKELQASANILGVKNIDFLGFNDGTLNNNSYPEVTQKIKEKLEKYHPDTVMTLESRGVSGHLDHIAVSMMTSYLYEKLSFIKNILYYCEDVRLKKLVADYFVYFPPGYKREEVDLIIDVKHYLDKKVRAMKAHVSQKRDADWILRSFDKYLSEDYFKVLEKS